VLLWQVYSDGNPSGHSKRCHTLTHMCYHKQTCKHAHMHTHTHAHTHTTHTHTHTHTHTTHTTHTHACMQPTPLFDGPQFEELAPLLDSLAACTPTPTTTTTASSPPPPFTATAAVSSADVHSSGISPVSSLAHAQQLHSMLGLLLGLHRCVLLIMGSSNQKRVRQLVHAPRRTHSSCTPCWHYSWAHTSV